MKKVIGLIFSITLFFNCFSQKLQIYRDSKTGKYGLKDAQQKVITEAKYNYIFQSHSFFVVELDGKRGFINAKGKEITSPVYDMATGFYEGMAHVKLNNKWGYIDTTGKKVISFIYDDAGFFSEGLAEVAINGKYGFVDKTGREIISLKYSKISFFKKGFAAVALNDKFGLINKKGQLVVAMKYDAIDYYQGFPAIISNNNMQGFIDVTGMEIVAPKYNDIKKFKFGLTSVNLNGKWAIISEAGKLLTPFKYDYTDFQTTVVDPDPIFSDGMLRVNIGAKWNSGDWFGGKWGFLNKEGKEVIDLKYDHVSPFEKGKAKVTLGTTSFYIDKSGRKIQ